ncbi:MAG: response regulator [Geobacteraceae bacterium]
MTSTTTPLRVLYLEDNPVDADLTRRELARLAPEIQLEIATTLVDAMERLAPACPSYDVVLSDLNLPDGSGLELLAHIRQRELPLAVVIITGAGDQEVAVSALKAGADDYLVKRAGLAGNLPLVLTSARARFQAARERRARQLHILYAEPNTFDVDLTRRYLAKHAPNISLEVVESGYDLLERLPESAEENAHPFDVLLLDYRLPGLNALETVKILRQERGQEIPIVLVTGHGSEEVAVQALRLGVDDYLVKQEGYLRLLPAILEKLQKQSELTASETRYRRLAHEFNSLLDLIPDSITLMSPNFKVLWSNKSSVVDLGKEPEDLVGSHCYDIRHNRGKPCDGCPAVESFCTGKAAGNIVTWPDGRVFELRTIPITEAGTVVSVIEVSRDITEHRNIENQLRQSQKMESIGILAGGVAHDFNNILTAIIGYGDLALMKMLPDDKNRYNIEQIRAAADRATHLTKDLLLFSRKQASARKPVDLNNCIGKMENFLNRILRENISYRSNLLQTGLPILADSYQIDQIIMNLAINAQDAMPDNGFFTITTDKIELDERFVEMYGYGKPGWYARMDVSDSGTGMDETTLNKIFEPFFTTKEVGKGTGLGLAAVYGIVKQHDGFIHVYSEPGKGTTFHLYLPLIQEYLENASDKTPKEAPAGGSETILLAEDNDMVRNVTTIVLQSAGYSVIAAVDGVDAIEKFREHADTIDLLLLDLIMPKMNGKEAYDQIVKIRPEIKVIFASGYAPDTVRIGMPQGEKMLILYKPAPPDELLRSVRQVLDGENSGRE